MGWGVVHAAEALLYESICASRREIGELGGRMDSAAALDRIIDVDQDLYTYFGFGRASAAVLAGRGSGCINPRSNYLIGNSHLKLYTCSRRWSGGSRCII